MWSVRAAIGAPTYKCQAASSYHFILNFLKNDLHAFNVVTKRDIRHAYEKHLKLPKDALKEHREIISKMVDGVVSDQQRLTEHFRQMGEKSEQPACVCQDTLRIH